MYNTHPLNGLQLLIAIAPIIGTALVLEQISTQLSVNLSLQDDIVIGGQNNSPSTVDLSMSSTVIAANIDNEIITL